MMQEFVLLLLLIWVSWISTLRPGIEPVISFTGVRDYARLAVASWTPGIMPILYNRLHHMVQQFNIMVNIITLCVMVKLVKTVQPSNGDIVLLIHSCRR